MRLQDLRLLLLAPSAKHHGTTRSMGLWGLQGLRLRLCR